MTAETKATILSHVLTMLASTDPEQISMRAVAEKVGIKQSVIYYYYKSKEDMLQAAFMSAQTQIREALMELPDIEDAHELMRQRIVYHLENGHLIIPMLRYFMTIKVDKPDQPGGFIPPQAYRHIREVIERGIHQGIYQTDTIGADARIIVHALNGFVMEYYPNKAFTSELVDSIQLFIERALEKGGR